MTAFDYRVFAVGLVAAVSACGTVSPVTMARLAALDPLTADPAELAVAIVVPEGFSVVPGTAKLTLKAARGQQKLAEMVTLLDRPLAGAVQTPEGSRATAYALAPIDVQRMRDWQATVAGWTDGGAASGTFGLGVDGCTTGDGPAPDALAAVYVRLEAGGSYLPLVPPSPMSALLGPDVMAAIKPCTGAR
ncbi:MAG: hypothetical protein ACK4RZ_01305 [Paracoccaceae bacterium]